MTNRQTGGLKAKEKLVVPMTINKTDTVELCRHVPCASFTIFSPRYHDNRVLLAAHKVRDNNKVAFTKAPSMGTLPYYINGKNVRKYPKTSNGTIDVYQVPLSELKPLDIKTHCHHEYA